MDLTPLPRALSMNGEGFLVCAVLEPDLRAGCLLVMHTGSMALYDAPPSSSPRLFLGLAGGTIAGMALMLGLIFSAAPRATTSPPASASTTTTTAVR